MDNPLAKLNIDYWYHAVTVLSGVILFFSLFIEIQETSNSLVQLVSLGCFLIGLGEWINHPLQTKLHTPNEFMPTGGITSGHPRNNRFLGICFVMIGILLLFIGFIS